MVAIMDEALELEIGHKVLEIGSGSGWHPHLHMLAFLDMQEQDFSSEVLKQELFCRYRAILSKKHGKYASDDYGIDVRAGNAQAGDYISKWSMEMEITKSPVKMAKDGRYSPFQLLEMSRNGDKQASALFREYAQAMAGRKQLTWSHKARAILGLGAELSDERIAGEPEPDDTRELMRFPRATWSRIVSKRLVAELLSVADDCDIGAILDFLERNGIHRIEVEVRDG